VKKFAILCFVGLIAATPVAAEQIGTASTVRNSVTGTVAGALRPGSGVHHREVITSETGAEAQLIFRDETVFNVGSGATVTLDEFIYDPNRKAGNIVLDVTKGAFRFISGSAKPESYTIKTPVATIGVRGTIFSANILSDLFMSLRLLQGQLLICLKPGAKIEGTGIDSGEPPVRRNGEDCYLVSPGLFSIGFGPLDDWQNPDGDTSDPNDGVDDPVDDYPGGRSFIECEECSEFNQ
jgi:hypothetical protein